MFQVNICVAVFNGMQQLFLYALCSMLLAPCSLLLALNLRIQFPRQIKQKSIFK